MTFVQLIVAFDAGLLISAHICAFLEMIMSISGQHELTAPAACCKTDRPGAGIIGNVDLGSVQGRILLTLFPIRTFQYCRVTLADIYWFCACIARRFEQCSIFRGHVRAVKVLKEVRRRLPAPSSAIRNERVR